MGFRCDLIRQSTDLGGIACLVPISDKACPIGPPPDLMLSYPQSIGAKECGTQSFDSVRIRQEAEQHHDNFLVGSLPATSLGNPGDTAERAARTVYS